MSHELAIHYFKSGTGFTAKCSCGEKIGHADSCSGSGLAYWLYQVQQVFNHHRKIKDARAEGEKLCYPHL